MSGYQNQITIDDLIFDILFHYTVEQTESKLIQMDDEIKNSLMKDNMVSQTIAVSCNIWWVKQ